MQFFKFVAFLTVILVLSVTSFSSKAALIALNGQTIGVLDLNGQVSTFEDFYNYDSASANTGLETLNTVIMFVAELEGQYGIFTIANKYGSGEVNGGEGRDGQLSVTIFATSGMVSFTDDPKEHPTADQLNFYWGGNFTDGYLFTGMNYEFSFQQLLSSRKGVDGIQFIDFKDGTLDSAEYSDLMSLDTSLILQTVVSAPAVVLLFGLGLLGFIRFRN